MSEKKTVAILTNTSNFMSATNATERAVWKKVGDIYVFSHMEKLTPTHTLEEFVGMTTPPTKGETE